MVGLRFFPYALAELRPPLQAKRAPMDSESHERWLIADVGATQTRIALVNDAGEGLNRVEVYENAEFAGLEPLLTAYLRNAASPHPAEALLAVAGPVCSDYVTMINRDWEFSQEGLRVSLGLQGLEAINDFAAIAWSLPALGPSDWLPIGSPAQGPRATLGVIGPGTGLGVSGLTPCGTGWVPLATEGGHVTLAAVDGREAAVVADLHARYGHCSAERVLSGPGLVSLYHCLRRLAGEGREGNPVGLSPAEVSARALNGEDGYAVQALDLFFAFLGTVASNLALTLGARGGIFLAGGILPRIAGSLMASRFRSRFIDKGRYRRYLEAIPTLLITHPCPALLGLHLYRRTRKSR